MNTNTTATHATFKNFPYFNPSAFNMLNRPASYSGYMKVEFSQAVVKKEANPDKKNWIF